MTGHLIYSPRAGMFATELPSRREFAGSLSVIRSPESTLAMAFRNEILNDRVAWYVDFWTEDRELYGVRNIAEFDEKIVPHPSAIFTSNENILHRRSCPLECPNLKAVECEEHTSTWNSEEVAEWFEYFSGQQLRAVLTFSSKKSPDTVAVVTVQANEVTCSLLPGHNYWAEYINEGLASACAPLLREGYELSLYVEEVV